jgi:triphosphoribosyl-dephospho-CoA synthase
MTMESKVEQRLWEIAEKSQFALLLDILTPKPGNVHRYHDHPDTHIIHFAASITRLGYPLYKTAKWGYHLTTKENEPSQLGALLKAATQAAMEPHGKNTLLGTILLFIPLTAAAGCTIPNDRSSLKTLRQHLSRILHNSTVDDAIELIRTLQIASPGGAIPKTAGWTAKPQAFDFQSPHTIRLIHQEQYTLRDLQALAAPYDAIAEEYTTDFSYTFETLYPQFNKALNRYKRLEDAVLATYLWELSHRPDTFIQRKAGTKSAQMVMQQAGTVYQRILKLPTTRWLEAITPFDAALRAEGSRLNPGTTADLLSASIFLALFLENIKSIL